MTLSEIRNEIWEAIGHDTRYNPSTDTSYNSGPYLTFVVNEAQRQIATWKDPQTERVLRFKELMSEMFFKSVTLTGTIASATTTTVTLDTAVNANADEYNGWVIETGSDLRAITDFSAARVATVHDSYSTAPSGTYTLYKRFFYLLPSSHAWAAEHIVLPDPSDRYRSEGNFLEPLKIEDLASQRTLDLGSRIESFPEFTNETGDPLSWITYGNKIVMDTNVSTAKWFRMEYYRKPTDMSADTDEPEIPGPFHYAMVLWGTWWGYRRKRENAAAYSVKRDLMDYMKTTVGGFDVNFERSNSQLVLKEMD